MATTPPPSRLLRGTMILTAGQVAGYALSFARNVILARTLGKADFGLAALFGMTLSLLEISGRMSFGHQIIQSKDGDSVSFQATSHTFQFLLSSSGAVLMVILSYPIACAFKVPEYAWSFAMLAAVPFARGFEHLDYCRQQRDLDYLPGVICELVPQLMITLFAWPLAVWLGDFRVIVWLMLGKAGFGILMTHWLAKRPYRWEWQGDYARGMWLFGWPLLLNGLFMFASQQADQVLVGAFLSLEQLAAYALALSLVSIPWFVFGRVGTSIMLPILAKSQDESVQFQRDYRLCVKYAAIGAVVLTMPLIVAGEQVVTLFYGSKYSGAGLLMALLGATSAIRFLRFVPAVAAMARADTMNQLYSNLWRGLSLPMALAVALVGGGAVAIAACALVAEVLATAFSVLRLQRRQDVPLRGIAGAVAYVLGFSAIGMASAFCGLPLWGYWPAVAATSVLVGLAILVAWLAFPEVVRSALKEITRKSVPGDSEFRPKVSI